MRKTITVKKTRGSVKGGDRFRRLALIFLLILAPAAWAQDYRILISNDDGIDSPLLAALADELSTLPGVEVVVAAPNENASGSSHSTAGAEIVVEEYLRDGVLFGYSVHGRPADAVRWGVMVLGQERPFDLVVSGINLGANVGNVAHLSGTVGAAMEGLYLGIPALAFSQETRGVDTAASARFAGTLVQRVRELGAPEGVLLSVNIPAGEIQGVRVRPMGESYLNTIGFEAGASSGGRTTYQRQRVVERATDPVNDTWAYQQGYITITPLKFDWTDYETISALQSSVWGLED